MVEQPTLIKRPVIEVDNGVIVGFKPAQQRELEAAI
jgi:arsenate reductase-like glutaredoxin family protein